MELWGRHNNAYDKINKTTKPKQNKKNQKNQNKKQKTKKQKKTKRKEKEGVRAASGSYREKEQRSGGVETKERNKGFGGQVKNSFSIGHFNKTSGFYHFRSIRISFKIKSNHHTLRKKVKKKKKKKKNDQNHAKNKK